MSTQQRNSVSRSVSLTIPELQQSKAAVLNTLASASPGIASYRSHAKRQFRATGEKGDQGVELILVSACARTRADFAEDSL